MLAANDFFGLLGRTGRDLPGNIKPTQKNLESAYSAIDKAVKKHLFHTNKAARLKSQIAKLASNKPAKVKKASAKKASTKKQSSSKKASTTKKTAKKAAK